MSGVCAIVERDGDEVDRARFAAAAAACRYRGPDRSGEWVGAGVALAHHALDTTPESRLERQPLVDRRSGSVLVLDGRVDNREELYRELAGELPSRLVATSDADLVQAALARWGAAGLNRILGDFAGISWTPANRTALCFRDHLGVRPLVWGTAGRTVVVSSSLAAVVAGQGDRHAVNRGLAGDLLRWSFERWTGETILAGVHRVPAGHALVVSRSAVRLIRYWDAASFPDRRLTEAECAERLRELLGDAVRQRLRAVGPVGIATSGGLDSSSIACLAHELAARPEAVPPVSLYAWLYGAEFPGADERRYQGMVAAACPLFAFVGLDGTSPAAVSGSGGVVERALEDLRPNPTLGASQELLRRAADDGSRVVLTGLGGDEVLNSDAYHAPELLLACPPRRALAELPHFRRAAGSLTGLALRAARAAVAARLTPPGLAAVRGLAGRRRREPWLAAAGPERPARSGGRLKWPRGGRWRVVRQATSGWRAALLAGNDLTGAEQGVELRHPFFDRRIVEWSVQVPPGFWFRGGAGKWPLRLAMRGCLPDPLRERQVRSHFTEVVEWRLRTRERASVERLLGELRDDLGIGFDAREYAAAWQGFASGMRPFSLRLLAPLYLARWLGAARESGPLFEPMGGKT